MNLFLSLFLVLRMLVAPAYVTCDMATYAIEPGDTLASIAEECQIPYTVILGINFQITDPGKIYPGQVIRLEAEAELPTDNQRSTGAPAPGGFSPEENTYVVRPGDTLVRIGLIFNTNPTELRELNPEIQTDNRIYPGQVLRLPGRPGLPGNLYGQADNPDAPGLSGQVSNNPALRGFVGVPSTSVSRSQQVLVNISSFPPDAEIDVRVKRYGSNHPTVIYDARTDALGNAFVTITIPSAARSGHQWVAEVVTTEPPIAVRGFSPRMTIK